MLISVYLGNVVEEGVQNQNRTIRSILDEDIVYNKTDDTENITERGSDEETEYGSSRSDTDRNDDLEEMMKEWDKGLFGLEAKAVDAVNKAAAAVTGNEVQDTLLL